MVYLQGFTGVFPWNVITYYIFGYLEKERGYDSTTTLLIMGPAILLMAAGYPAGGWLGDKLFKKTKRGRLIASEIGIVLGMVGLFAALNTPNAWYSFLASSWPSPPSLCPSPHRISSPPCMM
jgi:MFS family permease